MSNNSVVELQCTALEEIPTVLMFLLSVMGSSSDNKLEIYDELRASFDTGKTMPIAFRRKQLASLAHMIKDNIPRFEDAMKADIGKPPFESQMCSPRL